MKHMVTFTLRPSRPIRFETAKKDISFSLSKTTVSGLPYEGPYQATPRLYVETVLPTKGRIPRDDITVLRIPQYEVSNESGGLTLILGGE